MQQDFALDPQTGPMPLIDEAAEELDPDFPEGTSASSGDSAVGHIGRYTLKHRIGEGALGPVYAADDPVLGKLIALKTIRLNLASQERVEFNSVFLNEARAAAGLSHPYIATVYDAGISEQGAYIAMELLQGRDLRQLRASGWRPSPAQAVTIVYRVAEALGYAHSRGVVHGDIKPANIFLVGSAQPRVLDFGTASVALSRDGMIHEELLGGSPYYMAPEQFLQQPLDGRCDLFSLGVLLYELLTDARPFQGNDLDEITRAVLEYRPPMAHELAPHIPPRLSEIASRAMEKSPDVRLRSASVMARELKQWLDASEPSFARTTSPKVAPATAWRGNWVVGSVVGIVAGCALGTWGILSLDVGSQSVDGVEVATQAQVPATVAVPPVPVSPPAVLTAPPVLPAAAPELHAQEVLPQTPVVIAEVAELAVNPKTAESAAASAPSLGGVANPVSTASTSIPTVVARTVAQLSAGKSGPGSQARGKKAPVSASKIAAAAVPTGIVHLAVSPWGQVEVDGVDKGTAPPLSQLTLSEGRHVLILRNGELPLHRVSVNVRPGRRIYVKHRFGS